MNTYTYDEAEGRLGDLLDEAREAGEVRIRMADGTEYTLRPRPRSPLDVPAVTTDVRGDEIVAAVRVGREAADADAVPRFRTLKRPPEHPDRAVSREAIRRSVRAVHVTPEDGAWIVRRTGLDRVRRTFETRGGALAFAALLAREHDVDVFLHDEERYMRPAGRS